jgi:hypothetical protein
MMNKKLLLFGLAIAVAAGWFLLRKGRFDKKIVLDGQVFRLAKTIKRGEAANYFYVPRGKEMNFSDSFLQLVVFSGKISQPLRASSWQQLVSQYGLSLHGDDSRNYFGEANSNGIDIVSYAREIMIDSGSAYLIYLRARGQSGDSAPASLSAPAVYSALEQAEKLLQ